MPGFHWKRSFTVSGLRDSIRAGINEIRSRGVHSVVLGQVLFIFASCCWGPHVTTAAAVGLSVWALATRSPLISEQQRKGLLQAREDQFAAWEEEEKAALAHVRSGRRIRPTRRFGEDEDSLLHVACKHGDLSACELLHHKMPLYSGMWAIPAAEHVQWHVGELQINARGETALHLAVRSGSAAAVSYLLESATAQLVDVDARGAARAITAPPFTTSAPWSAPGRTPLHVAALEGHVEAARVLLEHGCHTGVPCGFECETPLAFAIKNGHLRLVQLLYSYGTQVWWHEECRNQRGASEAEQAAEAWPAMRDWMRKRRRLEDQRGGIGGRCITWRCSRLRARGACCAYATSVHCPACKAMACMCAQSCAHAIVLSVSQAVRRAPLWVAVRGASAPSSSRAQPSRGAPATMRPSRAVRASVRPHYFWSEHSLRARFRERTRCSMHGCTW